jgi:DNA-binding CsgD family transcriptional regulator
MAKRICQGMTNQEIAQDLGITDNTVRMHVRDLFRRIDVRDRVGAVVWMVHEDRRIDKAGLGR